VKRPNRKLTVDEHPIMWVGVNYWSAAGGPRMWRDYDHDVVVRELEVMREHGMTVTRSFFYWPDFMPAENTMDEQLVERYRDFLDAHETLGMSTIPTFIVGHMSGQNWDPSWRDGRSVFGDVSFVGQQAWYVRSLTQEFADHPAVAGWLLSNEIPIYGDWKSRGIGTINHAEVKAWAQILIDAIRAGGGTQPISIGDGAWGVEVTGADNGFRVRELAPMVDFHGPHVYRMETDPVRQNLGAAFICELLDIGGKPIVMEEFGVTSDYVDDENAAHYYRQVLHNTLLAGATGWLAWNNADYDTLRDREPYSHHPFEMHFGLVDAAGRVKDAAREVKAFSELLSAVDAPNLQRSDASTALLVPSYLEAQYPFTQDQDRATSFQVSRQAYVAAREADLAVAVVRELDGIPNDANLYLLPSAKQFTTPGWDRLEELVEAGATVYASVFLGEHNNQRGLWWPDVDKRFGVRKRTRYGLADRVHDDTLTLTFVEDFGGIGRGVELDFAVAGTINSRSFLPVEAVTADVIATDQHGAPALLRHRQGAGQWILGTFPIEYFASETPEVNPEPTWRIYDALAEVAGVRREIRVDDPRVTTDVMVHADGTRYAWFVSQHDQELEVTPRADADLTYVGGGSAATVKLAPYGVRVVRIGEGR
jgi:endo-1,4-beta-mannosidase